MKRFKTMIVAAMAAAVALSACSKTEQGPTPDNTPRTVRIGLSYKAKPNTRGEGATVPSSTSVSFVSGHIIFARPSGLIEKHIGVANAAGEAQVALTNLHNGELVIADVPASATVCHVISNDAAALLFGGAGITTDLKGTSMSPVLAEMITAAKLNSTTDVSAVPAYGSNTLSMTSGATPVGATPYDATVAVTIDALSTRLEIGKISSTDQTIGTPAQTYSIESFTVDGIYVTNTYKQSTLSSVVATGDLINAGSVPTNYSKTTGLYTAANGAATLADEFSLVATGTPKAVDQATTSNYWVYNLIPNGLPNVLVKLSNVSYAVDGGTPISLGVQYLSLSSYKEGGTAVTSFDKNNIYRLENLEFNYSDLSPIPFASNLDVQVTVNMFAWTNKVITWQ